METLISAVILAGGKSSRMGENKALLKINNLSLIEKIYNIVAIFTNDIIISCNTEEYNFLKSRKVHDLHHNCGAISGILAGLQQIKYQKSLIISCDVPLVNEKLINYIISNSKNYEATVVKHKNFLEPLIGVYDKQIINIIENQISNKDYSINNLLKKLNINILTIDATIDFYEENLFLNINTPQDYQKLIDKKN